MKDYEKLKECDRRARELAGLYAAEKDRADALEAELRALRENRTCKESLQVGNAGEMREALEAVVKVGYPHNFQREAPHIRGYCYEITTAIEKCFAALAEPPRNCDVGSLEEQSKRFGEFCAPQKCRECRLYVDGAFGDCGVRWSQMPYESEVKQ